MRSMIRPLAVILLGTLACSDGGESSNYQISAVAESNGQTEYANLALPILAQLLVESDGEPAEGITVNWSPRNGGSTATSSVTDADGIARTVWVLGPPAGTQTLLASVADADPKRVTFTATALAAVIDFDVIAETDSQVGTAGEELDDELAVVVTLNGVPTAGLQMEWFTEDGTITESSISDEDGIARASWTLPNAPGTYHALAYRKVGSVLTFSEFTATAVEAP